MSEIGYLICHAIPKLRHLTYNPKKYWQSFRSDRYYLYEYRKLVPCFGRFCHAVTRSFIDITLIYASLPANHLYLRAQTEINKQIPSSLLRIIERKTCDRIINTRLNSKRQASKGLMLIYLLYKGNINYVLLYLRAGSMKIIPTDKISEAVSVRSWAVGSGRSDAQVGRVGCSL